MRYLLIFALLLTACDSGGEGREPVSVSDGGRGADAGSSDAGATDAGIADAGPPPLGPRDSSTDQTPACGTAFVYAIEETIPGGNLEHPCKDTKGENAPEWWRAGYLRIYTNTQNNSDLVWVDDGLSAGFGTLKSRIGTECEIQFNTNYGNNETKERLIQVSRDWVEGGAYYVNRADNGTCEVATSFGGSPLPPP